jgi:hypothetical protein
VVMWYGAYFRPVLTHPLSAVAGALEYAEVLAPGTYGLAVLVGHDSGDLVQMS